MAKNWNMIDVSCTYILSGDPEGETWRQEFSYVGGRYVLVKGAAPADEAALADGANTADGGVRRGGQRCNASVPAGILYCVGQPGNRNPSGATTDGTARCMI